MSPTDPIAVLAISIERVQHKLAAGRRDADVYTAAAARVMDFYRARIEARSREGEAATPARKDEDVERRMRMAAVKAERIVIFRMLRSHRSEARQPLGLCASLIFWKRDTKLEQLVAAATSVRLPA